MIMFPVIEPPLIATDELELLPRVMFPVIVPELLITSKLLESLLEMAPIMVALLVTDPANPVKFMA